MAQNQERTILLVSDDAALCMAVRQDLKAGEENYEMAGSRQPKSYIKETIRQ